MSYNNSVLIGNWSEERLKNDYEFKLFLRKRDRKELLLQRSRNLFSNLLKERPLAISGTYVLYGYNVQVVASDMPANSPAPGEKRHYGLALSSLVTERQVDYMQNINDGCLMTLSPITTPCCRNTFVILKLSFLLSDEAFRILIAYTGHHDTGTVHSRIWSPHFSQTFISRAVVGRCTEDESLRGVKMNYGEEFLLRSENYGDPDAPPLYVRYTPEGVPGPADRMPIRLSSSKDSNCRWTTMPLLPRDRIEGLGSPVATGAKLVLKNCVADKSLCVMNQSWMLTFFGPECGVTCRNHIDIHKRHTAENVFTLVSDIATKSKD